MFRTKEEFKDLITTRVEETYGRTFEKSHITERYLVLGKIIREGASLNWMETKRTIKHNDEKEMYYFSMEFLIGRLLSSNLINLGVYDVVKEGLADLGQDINELEDLEADAGLGNGGLGRLASCFIDSLATLDYAGHGNCIRYDYGLFKQRIYDNKQVEVPDNWLALGFPWEIRKPKHAVTINIYGNLKMSFDEDMVGHVSLQDAFSFKAVPYDVPIIGADTKTTNTLRLWHAEPADDIDSLDNFEKYITKVNMINHNLYPNDTTSKGKLLRLTQQYMFSAAGLCEIIKKHKRNYGTLDTLADKVCIQLNDTHPVLAIPELMRILMDENGYSWDNAWKITSNVFNYTNHTVLQEALERWDIELFKTLLPRIYLIIDEIHQRFLHYLRNERNITNVEPYLILKNGQIHMANLAVITAVHVNGVAKLHTEILKNDVMRQFNELYPEKFVNKTNGITHRRWLINSNPGLYNLLISKIGSDFKHNPIKLNDFEQFKEDKATVLAVQDIKLQNKKKLAKYIKDTLDITVDVNSVFDIQAKRFHAYKRQMLNCLHIIYLYNRLKADPSFKVEPTTFIFAGKAAGTYVFAKKNIELINVMQKVINNDPDVNKFIKVVFIPNYSVSLAEILIPACDVSEQISTAGKEASGTGNMKFMMNGAITLGTLDGANVEIAELVGENNIFIFGLRAEEAKNLYHSHEYNATEAYKNDKYLRDAVLRLVDGTFMNDGKNFEEIYNELIVKNDEYLLFKDFESYRQAHKDISKLYQNKAEWTKACIVNIAKSAKFSSDRTIEEYVEEIWHLNKIEVK